MQSSREASDNPDNEAHQAALSKELDKLTKGLQNEINILMNGTKIFIKDKLYKDFIDYQLKYTETGIKHFNTYFKNQNDYEWKDESVYAKDYENQYSDANYQTFNPHKNSMASNTNNKHYNYDDQDDDGYSFYEH